MASPYEILGLPPDADETAIQRAYRQKVKEVHPDQGGSAEAFQRVKRAYEELKAGGGPVEADTPEYGPEPDPEPEPEPQHPRVEYLNYDVLDDHGWNLADDDLFEKAAEAGLDHEDYGEFEVLPRDTLLEAAEREGYAWPFACRGGACTNCAVAVVEGEIPPPTGHILPPDMIEKGIRLSCLAAPVSQDTQVVYNVKHMPGVNELLLPASRFEKAYPSSE